MTDRVNGSGDTYVAIERYLLNQGVSKKGASFWTVTATGDGFFCEIRRWGVQKLLGFFDELDERDLSSLRANRCKWAKLERTGQEMKQRKSPALSIRQGSRRLPEKGAFGEVTPLKRFQVVGSKW
jgi:hypothetical protein